MFMIFENEWIYISSDTIVLDQYEFGTILDTLYILGKKGGRF